MIMVYRGKEDARSVILLKFLDKFDLFLKN